MKKEIVINLTKLQKLGNELGLPVKEVGIIRDYFDSDLEIPPTKIIGIKIEGGVGDKLTFNQDKT